MLKEIVHYVQILMMWQFLVDKRFMLKSWNLTQRRSLFIQNYICQISDLIKLFKSSPPYNNLNFLQFSSYFKLEKLKSNQYFVLVIQTFWLFLSVIVEGVTLINNKNNKIFDTMYFEIIYN